MISGYLLQSPTVKHLNQHMFSIFNLRFLITSTTTINYTLAFSSGSLQLFFLKCSPWWSWNICLFSSLMLSVRCRRWCWNYAPYPRFFTAQVHLSSSGCDIGKLKLYMYLFPLLIWPLHPDPHQSLLLHRLSFVYLIQTPTLDQLDYRCVSFAR